MDEGCKKFVINMEKSTVVNSIGVSILIELIERIQEADGRLFFCKLTKVIAKTFTIMGLAQFAGMEETEEAAIAAMSA
jgi:anti-anti-sigma factor